MFADFNFVARLQGWAAAVCTGKRHATAGGGGEESNSETKWKHTSRHTIGKHALDSLDVCPGLSEYTEVHVNCGALHAQLRIAVNRLLQTASQASGAGREWTSQCEMRNMPDKARTHTNTHKHTQTNSKRRAVLCSAYELSRYARRT